MSDRTLRVILVVLAIPQLATGFWAVLAPSSFYLSFPFGRGWVVGDGGPFNQHLITDAGSGFLATGAMLALAALWAERRLVQASLVALAVFALPHFIYHLTHPPDALSSFDKSMSLGGLGLTAVVPVALLVLLQRPNMSRQPSSPSISTVTERN